MSVFFLGGSQGSAKGKQGGKEAENLVGVGGQGKPVPEGVRGMRPAIPREGRHTETEAETLIFRDTDWHRESETQKGRAVDRETERL